MRAFLTVTAVAACIGQVLGSGAAGAYLVNERFTTRSASVSKTTDRAALRSSVMASAQLSQVSRETRSPCPNNCSNSINPGDWFAYHSRESLNRCNNTMLLDFALFNDIDDPETRVSIAACTADLEEFSSASTSSTSNNATCLQDGAKQAEVTSSLQLASSGSSTSASVSSVIDALNQLRSFYTLSNVGCEETIKFAYSGIAAVGVYVGSGLAGQSVIVPVLEQLATHMEGGNIAENLLVQLCDDNSARYSLGIFVNTNADMTSVQRGLQSWKNGSCISTIPMSNANPTWHNLTFLAPSLLNDSNSVGNISISSNSTRLARQLLISRDTCTTIQVVSGDTCATLASECGITAAEFTEYNSASDECSSLAAGEHVCCSSGTLPDFSPSAYSNGTCYTYTVISGDSCSTLAATYDITVDEIAAWNNDTWGWNGCSDLLAGYNICLSSGDAPMPTTIANAVCGPQMNGTAVAPAGTDLSTLNECPLNACCNIWGQCGTTAEFCTISNSTTGAPGTAANGTNGCISNCGTDIMVSDMPAETYSIAYFEAFDQSRPCLKMSVTDINVTSYTHIHFAFVTLNTDFSINYDDVAEQLSLLSNMTNVKRVVSIGGWTFSTDADTYAIFRDAVSSEANRATLISNIANFLSDYNLDGVDWDWEYPDEPDISGIPAGTTADSTGYFLLLDELQTALEDTDKTISITAPASYWYLERFPIEAISAVVDYIVLMTYDLHGQWDYGNEYSDSGCPDGSCLRSHVNLTETLNALSMITKADVPSNMIVVGVTSYARSFEMTESGCWTEECTFTGPDSGAIAGACTQTAGYLAQYEVDEVIANNPTAEVHYDSNSFSSILVYDDTQWAAYMNDSNKQYRRTLYESLTFLGTADWAVDLVSEDGESYDEEVIYAPPSLWSSSDSNNVACIPPCTIVLPPFTLGTTTTITWPSLTTTLLSSSGSETYTITTTFSVAPVTTTEIEFWPITFYSTDPTQATIAPVQSVMPPSFVVTLPEGIATFPPTQIGTPTIEATSALPASSASSASSASVASSSSSTTVIVPVFYTTPKAVTIQPQATISISTGTATSTNTAGESTAGASSIATASNTSGGSTTGASSTAAAITTNAASLVPSVTYSSGSPKTTCSGSGCGKQDCLLFGCDDSCGVFGCGGGCGIFGCGGGCEWFGCPGTCSLEECGGLGCTTGECGTGGCPSGDCSDWTDTSGDDGADCDDPKTATVCTEIVSSFRPTSQSTYSTTTKTHCSITEGCSATGSTATTTVTTSESYSTITVSYYEIYSSEAAAQLSSELSSISSEIVSWEEAWDATRFSTMSTSPTSSSTTTTPTTTSTTSTTTSATATPTAAKCALWDSVVAYQIEIYDIEGFATDGGAALKKQEKGCGTITGWKWEDATDTSDALVHFYIDFFIKAGCIERAIVSAGGPKISCAKDGIAAKRSLESDPTFLEPSDEERENLVRVYGNSTADHAQYVPMDWSTENSTSASNSTEI